MENLTRHGFALLLLTRQSSWHFVIRMKEVEVGGVKVLLLKSEGTYHAMGAKCSHYGAPLVNGQYVCKCFVCPALLSPYRG